MSKKKNPTGFRKEPILYVNSRYTARALSKFTNFTLRGYSGIVAYSRGRLFKKIILLEIEKLEKIENFR